MSLWKVLSLIVISHFLTRNRKVTRLMDITFEKAMCSFVIVPLINFVTNQKGWQSCFTWEFKKN